MELGEHSDGAWDASTSVGKGTRMERHKVLFDGVKEEQ